MRAGAFIRLPCNPLVCAIENAKALVEQGQVEATVSKTKKFNHYNNQEYMEQYAINRDNIKKISNNAGQWLSLIHI